MTKEVLQMALDALQLAVDTTYSDTCLIQFKDAITAIEQALEPKPLPGADWTITMRRMMNAGCSKRKCTCKPEDAENCIWWDEPGDAPQQTMQGPLITAETSLRFRLECEQSKSKGIEEEVMELKGRIAKLKAEPAQEPVAWGNLDPEFKECDRRLFAKLNEAAFYNAHYYELTPLYAAPQARQPLSADEIESLTWHLSASKSYEDYSHQESLVVDGYIEFARAIEAAIKGGAV